ncbi:MAG: hypothetical protein Q9217_006248 [Psora testacea]
MRTKADTVSPPSVNNTAKTTINGKPGVFSAATFHFTERPSSRQASSHTQSHNQQQGTSGPPLRSRGQSIGMNGQLVNPPPPAALYVRALYDYEADDRTSLSFRQGDTIQVITQLASGWWDGIINDVRGWFPSNYCVVVTGPEEAPTTSSQQSLNGGELSGESSTEEEYEEREEEREKRQIFKLDESSPSANDVESREQQEAAFWIPQATPDGRLFYFNTLTGVSKVELPLETPTSANETGPRDRMNINVPDQTRPPPEMMARGFERDEEEYDEAESASEVDESLMMQGSRPRRRNSYISDGVSPAASQESFNSPYMQTRGFDHQTTSMNAVAQTPLGMAGTTTFTSNALSQMSSASVPRSFVDDGSLTLVTWNKLVENIRRAIESYRQAINNADRSEYVRKAEDISDHLRMLLSAASGTTDNHSGNPSIISTNKALYPHFRDMMSRFSKLVLSSHIAAADFPAADAYSKCLQEAEGVLHGVYGYVEVARSQRGEDIPRLVPGFVLGSANGGSWQSNGLNSKDPMMASSFMDQDDYDSYNEPVLSLERPLLTKMEELKRMILLNIRRLEEHLAVREKLITSFRHEQIGNSICQAAGVVLSVFRPWISMVESIDLSPLGSAFQNPQLLDFASQKQRLYDLVAQLVLACQTVGAPLSDEWAEERGESLEDRVNEVRTLVRQLETCISQIGFSLQLLLDMMPRDSDSFGLQDTEDLKRHRTTEGRGPSKASTTVNMSNQDQPDLADIGTPMSCSDGVEPGTESYRTRQQDNSKLKKFFGEVPRDIEEPSFLRLDYETEIAYDSKVDPPQLRGGTLIALVEQLTRHDRLDSPFNNTFLLTYKSFTTASELFELLVKRFSIQPPRGISENDYKIWVDKKQKPIRFRVVNILKSWFDNYWMEELGEESNELLRRVYSFAKDSVATTATPGSAPLMASVERRMRGQDPNAKGLVPNQSTSIPAPIMPKNMKKLKFLDIDATEFARQLTIIESRLYGRIKPTECLNKQWQKKVSPEDNEPAPNVKALILHSNQLTNWVAEMILNQPDVKKRVVVIKHFVSVADKCRSMNNFSTLTSIISALGTAPIHRLQRTWSQVNARTQNVLENMRKLMSSSKNFAEYRETLHLANPPCIPFFGIYLTDLTFIEDGIPGIIKRTSLINFAKRAKTAEVIGDIQQYQNVPYSLKPVGDLQDYILSNMQAAGDVHEAYEKSLDVEPREREDEKITRLVDLGLIS